MSTISGYFSITDVNDKIISEGDTIQCCHCGRHWKSSPGSKKVRGYCARCNGYFCGPECQKCVPIEQQLDNLEAGRNRLWLPTD